MRIPPIDLTDYWLRRVPRWRLITRHRIRRLCRGKEIVLDAGPMVRTADGTGVRMYLIPRVVER